MQEQNMSEISAGWLISQGVQILLLWSIWTGGWVLRGFWTGGSKQSIWTPGGPTISERVQILRSIWTIGDYFEGDIFFRDRPQAQLLNFHK